MQITSLLLLAWSLVFLPVPAGQAKYSLQGAVTADGTSVRQPVIVHLEALGSFPVQQVVTDDSGNFVFGNVPAGVYYVRVKHEDFEEAAQRIELPAYDRDVTILLQPKHRAPARAGEILLGSKFEVDVRQLSIPENAVREYKQALEENKSGKSLGAIQRLRQALQLAPNFIEAAFHLGSTLYKIGHLEDAERTLRRALMIAPKEPQLHLMLANVLVKEGKYQQAVSEIDTYLKDNPNGADRASAETTRSQLIRAMEK
jgi:tetratricopeptide (TPR) repeat protein